MTGLSANTSYLFLSSTTQKACYRYVAPGITSRYCYTTYGGLSPTRDNARDESNGWIWVACSSTSYPIRAYKNSTCQYLIGADVVPYAYGLAIDEEGFLWVSDIVNDVIYHVDPYATGLETSTWARIKYSLE